MLDDARRARLDVERRHRELLVGEQRHPRRAGVDPRHATEEPVLGDDRRVERDAVVRADRDDDVLREAARRTGDHRGGEARVVVREARPVAEREQRLELVVLVRGELVLDRLLAQRLVLLAKPLRVGARGEERIRPAVDVAERLRDRSPAIVNGRRAAAAALSAEANGPASGLPERERDQREREHDEHTHHDAPPEGGGRSRGGLAGGGTPDVDAQHRRACGAMTGHSGRLYRACPQIAESRSRDSAIARARAGTSLPRS